MAEPATPIGDTAPNEGPAHARMTRLVATLSHDLRSPLQSLLGSIDLLALKATGAAEQRAIARLRGVTHALEAKLRQVAAYNRLEAGAEPLVLSETDVAQLVREACAAFAPRAHAQGLALHCDLAPPDATHTDTPASALSGVHTDGAAVRQILHHLLDNALRHTLRGEVRVALWVPREAPQHLHLAVSDTGIGLAPAWHDEVFAPGVRLNDPRMPAHDGVGLGLATVQRLCERLGGQVRLHSQPEAGSRFTVTLPRLARQWRPPHPSRPPGARPAMSTPTQPVALGTPLSPSAARVMLLGSGELGKEVLMALQRLGVETIAVDRYANAPGQQVAHHAHTITMSDAAQLRALIEAEHPHLVVPEIEAIATHELEKLEAEGLVRVIPTARAARLTMDREGIRRLAAETLGLPTSPYRFCDSLAELQAAIDGVDGQPGIGYPCIVKPVMSSSGKGQSKIDGPADVQKAWDHAMAGGRVSHGRIIVEGFIDFDYEITLLTVRAARQGPAPQMLATSFCEPIGHKQVSGDYVESWQPQPMNPLALQRAQAIAQAVTDNLGGQGLFGVELFVKGDEVWFSEVSPRPHDTGLVTLSTQVQSEFELHARAILGLPVDTSLRTVGASAVIYGGVDAQDVVFEGLADALSVPGTDLRLFGKPESFVKRRMGVALATDTTVEAARAKARQAAAKVTVKAAQR